tara:strand:- start:3042 stop:4706 length:1665 start_codon:yes stop_codon:yes gene_type:complete
MATFSGRTSPTALAALAPSINNLAAAKRAKSQAAAGLMNTLGVQFEKQKQQTAKREQNEAAQQVAEKLLQDPAFRRQAPGITDSASLVKLVGAENVIGYGMKTQEADRVAQQSAANIGLIKKEIEQYDIDAKQREADEASSKAFTTLAGGIYSDGFTQEDLMAGLKGLNSSDAVRALNIYNERNPGEMLEQRTIGGRTFVYNTKTGATFDLGTGSELPEAYTKGLALIKEQFAEGTPEYNRAVQDLTDRTLGYDVTLGETAFGGQPAAAAAAGGAAGVPIAPTETETVLFERLPDNIFTEGNMVDPDVLEAELAKMDFLSPQEAERIRQLAAQESVNRRRDAYLEATGEKPEDTSRSTQEMVGQGRVAGGSFANPYEFLKGLISGRNPTTKAPPDPRLQSIQQARAIQESPISAPTTSRSTQEIIGEARAIQGLPSEVQLQDRALKQRQAAFENAKELARQELAKKLSGPERDKVLKELDDARIDEIMSLKGKSAQTKTQKKVREALLNILRGPEFIRRYGINELPGKLLDLIPDMRTKRERERLERLEKQSSK